MSILLPVGKVGKLFGLDGGILVNLYDTFPGNMNNEEPLFVKIDGLAVPLFTEHFERRGQKGALMRFADIDTPARAEELLGLEVFVRKPDKDGQRAGRGEGVEFADGHDTDGGREGDTDELFFDDLVGYKAAVTEQGPAKPMYGTITAFLDSEMNPLLQLDVAGREVFIPAADEFITEIDTITHTVSLTIPEGLLELYL